jgi:hypothetical protein
MTDYIKADVGLMTVIEDGRERTIKTWAHRKPMPHEVEARRSCASMLRCKRIARIAKWRQQGMSGGRTE